MKILSKRNFLIGVFLILVTIVCFFTFSFKRKIFIIGFGYKNDIIIVRQSSFILEKVKVDTNNVDSMHVCSFYETFNYYTLNGRVTLNIEIDSANHKLLDTLVLLTGKHERPFISFEKPTETKFKRRLFIGNQTLIF